MAEARLRRAVLLLVALGLYTAAGSRVSSANFIRYQCVGLDAVAIVDDGVGDADPTVDAIEHAFSCDVIGGDFSWHAEGTLIGVFGPPDSATTSISNLTIENTGGNVRAQQFLLDHVWQTPLGPPTPQHSASLDGHFDNASGTVNGARIDYTATVFSVSGAAATILTGAFPLVGFSTSGPAPIPFSDDGGPVELLTPIQHKLDIRFYLDSPGDSIVFGDGEGFGAEAAPIPEPGTLSLVATTLIAWLACRRRHRVGKASARARAGTSLDRAPRGC